MILAFGCLAREGSTKKSLEKRKECPLERMLMLRPFGIEISIGLGKSKRMSWNRSGCKSGLFCVRGNIYRLQQAGADAMPIMPLCVLFLEPGNSFLSFLYLLKSQSSFRSFFLKPAVNLGASFSLLLPTTWYILPGRMWCPYLALEGKRAMID